METAPLPPPSWGAAEYLPFRPHTEEGRDGSTDVPSLINICLAAVAAGSAWTVQRRKLERLPPVLANTVLYMLWQRRAFDAAPHLLDRFAGCVTCVALHGDQAGISIAQLIAWLASFRRVLVPGCRRISSVAGC
jgi:hypothetical protein